MTIRASDSAHLSLLQTLVNQNRAQYNKLTEQISSGNKYLKRSDDAAETNKAALVDADETANTQFKANVSTASAWETASYSYISDMSDQFKKAYSLATEANNTVEQTSGWSEIATELGSCIDSLLSDANAKYLGTSLFAGTNTGGADPFSLVGATNTLGNAVPGFYEVSYTGNDTRRSIQTSSSSKLSYGTTGDQLFSNVEYKYAETVDGVTTTYTWNNPNLTPEDPCDFNTLQAVSDLKSYLKCGGALSAEQLSYLQEKYGMYTIDSSGTYSATKDTPDADTIFKRILGVVQTGSSKMSTLMATNSASQNRLDSLDSTLTTSIDTAETAYSNMMSVDTVKAATDLSTMETILTASLTMAGKISNMSIINFI